MPGVQNPSGDHDSGCDSRHDELYWLELSKSWRNPEEYQGSNRHEQNSGEAPVQAGCRTGCWRCCGWKSCAGRLNMPPTIPVAVIAEGPG